ncbi:hypothetical protein SCHPADRAFT_406560 [Schizopora paradoxa]|uniref:Uncharacterized protein n=1 Tax=Schizopora paradoxa TaxID=27342 RepID=A0A0H2RTA6_9AGAM|nr:hypothetical protein SCHPADRAFT_406560 [Schizopora paradoxa]
MSGFEHLNFVNEPSFEVHVLKDFDYNMRSVLRATQEVKDKLESMSSEMSQEIHRFLETYETWRETSALTVRKARVVVQDISSSFIPYLRDGTDSVDVKVKELANYTETKCKEKKAFMSTLEEIKHDIDGLQTKLASCSQTKDALNEKPKFSLKKSPQDLGRRLESLKDALSAVEISFVTVNERICSLLEEEKMYVTETNVLRYRPYRNAARISIARRHNGGCDTTKKCLYHRACTENSRSEAELKSDKRNRLVLSSDIRAESHFSSSSSKFENTSVVFAMIISNLDSLINDLKHIHTDQHVDELDPDKNIAAESPAARERVEVMSGVFCVFSS